MIPAHHLKEVTQQNNCILLLHLLWGKYLPSVYPPHLIPIVSKSAIFLTDNAENTAQLEMKARFEMNLEIIKDECH